jgi:ferritin
MKNMPAMLHSTELTDFTKKQLVYWYTSEQTIEIHSLATTHRNVTVQRNCR